jgi:nitrite reductase (NADH) small subunit
MITESSTDTSRLVPAGAADLAYGECRILQVGSQSIGVFHTEGRYFAVRNYCPHEGAELCKGKVTGTNLPTDTPGTYEWGREGLILRCPWHQWEFDLETGRHLANSACRVRTYPVIEREGSLFLEI